jgi:hypothetical protein
MKRIAHLKKMDEFVKVNNSESLHLELVMKSYVIDLKKLAVHMQPCQRQSSCAIAPSPKLDGVESISFVS